ncbi:hypothetical protein SAMN05444354_118163 [Stigmatella aurantiaca]|uniref:Uncharacterized protein n=1 Tax=Stigmatella aurantiaca TaxID=41 RepID=A0A1H7ZCN4_STIAU|nr:hypothetical protein [Stigmatella aurantiaca]SEM56076.1 hypothetical protein SAMN05444354_118163 [Stigmatella aurantiaca]
MPDFVARYQLSGPPPQGWKEQLEKFAADSGLKAFASIVGKQAVIQCRVPESSAEKAGAIAKAFFDEAAAALTGASGGTWIKLVSSAPVRQKPPVLLYAIGGTVALAAAFFLKVSDATSGINETAKAVIFAVMFLATGVWLLVDMRAARALGVIEEQLQQHDEAAHLARQIAEGEDPRRTTRIEAARVSLRMRAGRLRRDADQLWQRSVWAYRGALSFYVLSIAGPGMAATLVFRADTLDWHYMFGGFGLAAVPLTIGTALLRHDTKLREQYEKAANNVATLERYELALDYARIGAQPSYDATLQQVITQLLTLPPATPGAAATSPGGKEDVESQAAITAVATKLVDAVTTTLGQKK